MDIKTLTGSILVPVDFSETSILAIEHAASIAVHDKDTITLLHVIEGANFDPVTETTAFDVTHVVEFVIEEAANNLKKIIADKTGGVTYKFLIVSGKAHSKITETANQQKSDFIVMGAYGSSGIQSFAGSNASKVIQQADCPVVVVKTKSNNNGYKNIVLPLDLSEETKQKVSHAVELAEYFHSTVHVVSVNESDEFLADKINANLKQVENYFKDRNIETTATIIQDSSENFADHIINWAIPKNADLIVIMSQQEKSFREYFVGSYAQQIVNKSPIPVMTVAPDPKLAGDVYMPVGTGFYASDAIPNESDSL